MNTIKQLIEKYCPEGVEYKKLGEIGFFYSGLSGKSKDDFKDGNAMFITYMNVYSNPSTKLDVIEKVKIGQGEKQNKIEKGDILFTGSSETPDECGMSSVVTDDITSDYYLNSFCFGFRLNNKDTFEPNFLKHLFRDRKMRAQIARTANGVTRYNVSKKLFARIIIPVPPLPVQHEIVRILDNFTSLEAELEAELEARRKQYEYYRDQLLSFKHLTGGGKNNVLWKTLGEVCKVLRGKRLTKKELSDDGPFPVFHGGIEPIGYFSEGNREAESVMIIDVGASAGTVGYSKKEFWSSDGCFCLSHVPTLDQRYLFFLLQSLEKNLKSKVRRAGIPTLDSKVLENLSIPIPPLSVQRRIVSILDRFESLVNDITTGLPAEIAARRQQYEYYRDQLLSFKRKS